MLIALLSWLVLSWLFAVAALAVFNLVLVRFIQLLVPPIGRFVEIGGLRLHLVDSGEQPGREGPPLLFIHGLLGQLNHFSYALAERFPERRVVLIDRPGSGYSEQGPAQTLKAQAELLARVIDKLGLEKPLVVGHSLGGAVALDLALNHREKISGLALIAPLTHLEAEPPKAFAALSQRSRLALWFGAWTLGPAATLLRAGVARDEVFAPDPMPARFWSKGGGLLGARPAALLAASSDIVTQPTELPGMMARYGALDLPIGVLFGLGDPVLDPDRQGAAFCAAAPGATLTKIAGGHMLPVTRPAETEAFIRGVLARRITGGK
ncbi:alpha/beta fold hydrolase [Rhodoblastus sp.]|uniref:alpha/beta fold hydrolase n=1 Tax=Rhodoblastus sp. TaxID=1962975 RepID=UPI0035B49013